MVRKAERKRQARHDSLRFRALAAAVLLALASGCHKSVPDTSPTPFLDERSESTFDQIDHDGNGRLGRDAFHRGLSEHYYFRQGIDLDGDGTVLQVELATALFELWDGDESGAVSESEWSAGLGIWFPDRRAGAHFEVWDESGDGFLDVIELGEGAMRSGTFSAYDLDGNGIMETREVSDYLFSQWDVNGDGVIDATEWRVTPKAGRPPAPR